MECPTAESGQLLTQEFLLRSTYFEKTLFPPEEVSAFLKLVSTTGLDLRDELSTATYATDMAPVQRRPLLRLKDGSFLVFWIQASYSTKLDRACSGRSENSWTMARLGARSSSAEYCLNGMHIGCAVKAILGCSVLRTYCKRVALAPLQIATFPDLERLLPYTQAVSFVSMLEAANKSQLRAGNFRQRSRQSIENATPDRDFVKGRWHQLAAEMSSYLPKP